MSDFDYLNNISNDVLPNKTLDIVISETNVGKSLWRSGKVKTMYDLKDIIYLPNMGLMGIFMTDMILVDDKECYSYDLLQVPYWGA